MVCDNCGGIQISVAEVEQQLSVGAPIEVLAEDEGATDRICPVSGAPLRPAPGSDPTTEDARPSHIPSGV